LVSVPTICPLSLMAIALLPWYGHWRTGVRSIAGVTDGNSRKAWGSKLGLAAVPTISADALIPQAAPVAAMG
jgi:hypothetical protein